MGKLVYLFELDSYNNTDEDIKRAIRAIYREIVVCGNTVAITYNQLVESRCFLSLLNDPQWSDSITQLFRYGAIKISQFGDIRTPSQYLINALGKEDGFIFSGFPIKSSQKSLLELTRRSLINSDLTELNEYLDREKRSRQELCCLFREVTVENGKQVIIPGSLRVKEMEKVLKNLKVLLRLVLQLSDIDEAFNAPRARKELAGLRLADYIGKAISLTINVRYWDKARKLLKDMNYAKYNDRSTLLTELYNASEQLEEKEKEPYALAQAIVNVCYNYTCEASISDVSKHYNISEILNCDNKGTTFLRDFQRRLRIIWRNGKDYEKHFLLRENNEFSAFSASHGLPNMKRAVRAIEYRRIFHQVNSELETVPRYEKSWLKQIVCNKFKIAAGAFIKLLTFLVTMGAAVAFEMLFNNGLQSIVENRFPQWLGLSAINSKLVTLTSTIAALLVVQLISIMLVAAVEKCFSDNERFPANLLLGITSLSDALESFVQTFFDLLWLPLYSIPPYAVYSMKNNLETESVSEPIVANYVSSDIKRYKAYREKNKDSYLFRESTLLPIVNILNDGEDSRLTKIQELTGKRYGITYTSPYHTMIVDPVMGSPVKDPSGEQSYSDPDNRIYAYERLVKTAKGDGVVGIPLLHINGEKRFVLLQQYRHALREMQYGFPRGFGENGITVAENVCKEITEEIHATFADSVTGETVDPKNRERYLQEIGCITPDSGAMSGIVRIYTVHINGYDIERGYEGIEKICLVDQNELEAMIQNHMIQDGFTISAYCFWKLNANCTDVWNGGGYGTD